MANNITLSYPSAFHHQFLDLNGKPLTGGKLYTYIAGSTTPVVTYKTISGGTESANRNTNPIILDMAGMAELVIATDTAYKFVLFDKNDAKIAEWDNVTGNIGGGGGVSEDIVVVGTPNEIDVSGSVTQGVKRYVISLSNSVKSTILYLVGLYNNVLNSLGNKADKVQGATAGNLAALDASGNLTDSGSKAADFKTKQTPVADPSASGNGLDFIDSVTQDANGVITPHKKTIQDGTTAQKGVVKLSNAIDSTSVTEAATPKALKDAYDELNNKIVARATFLSQAEWAVQSQLPGDPAKVYYVENGTGEDAYTVYVWKESTSTYEEVDESSIDLDGYWHDSPTTTGSGNVVTNITLGNDGVPQVEKGMSAEPAFSVLPVNKGGTGADTIKGALSTLTSETQHYDTLPTDDTLIVYKFGTATASNGALYTRKLSYLWTYIQNRISSVLGLTASSYGGKAATAGTADSANSATTASAAASGSALESAINAKQATISDLATIRSGATAGASALQPSGNGSNLSVTPDGTSTGYDLGSSTTLKAFAQKFKNLVGALKALAFKDKASYDDLSSGVQSSLDKADSALQSHQSVTDNNPTLSWGTTSKVGTVGSTDLRVTMPANPAQNLPASVITSGTFDAARIPTIWPDKMPFGRADYSASTTGYKNIALIKPPSNNNGDILVSLDVYEFNASGTISYRGFINIGCRRDGSTYSYKAQYFGYQLANCSIVVRYSGNTHNALVYVGKTNSAYCSVVVVPKRGGNYDGTFDYSSINLYNDPSTEDISSYYNVTITNTYIPSSAGILVVVNGAVGSTTNPVYVDSNGQVQPCDPSQMGVGAASYASAAAAAASGSTLETKVNKGLAAYKETYTNVTLIQGNIYSKTIVLEIGQENSPGNGIRLFLNNNTGTFEVSIRSGTWNNWMDGGSVIWMLQASFGVGVNSPVTKINNDTKSLAILTTQTIGEVDIGGSPGQYPINGTISGRFYFVNNAASGILTFEASFSTSQSTQYGGLNDTFVIGKAEWTSFADHKVTSILT